MMVTKRKINAATEDKVHEEPDENDTTDSKPTKSSKCWRLFQTSKVIIICAASSVCFTLTNVIFKKLKYIGSGQLSTVMLSALWAFSLPIAACSVREVFGQKNDWPLLLLQSLILSAALYLIVTAYKCLPLALAAVFTSTTPAVTSVIARYYLKEPCGIIQSVAIIITIGAMLLSVRLPELLRRGSSTIIRTDYDYVIGLASATASVFLYALHAVLIRKLKHIHFSVMNFYAGFIGMFTNGATTILSTYYSVICCGWDQVLVILMGLFAFLGYCLMTLAGQLENAGIVSILLLSLNVVMAVLFDVLLFNVVPDAYTASGACLVILSGTIIGLKNWFVLLPDSSRARKRLGFIMF